MLKKLIHKNYIFYGSSIIIGRGLEYFVLLFAANYLQKEAYGELEYYKKIIEVVSSVLAFGFPALILSYTKSNESKRYFYLLSIIFVLILGAASAFLGFFIQDWWMLLPALIFYALFFTGGITQSFQLVQNGSNYASIYKIVVSLLFYTTVFVLIYFLGGQGKSYVYPSYILLPIALLFSLTDFYNKKIEVYKIKKYWKLFKKLLFSSFTLVISNFANLMFLYTDIFIIKLLSDLANSEIADLSFALNIGGILLIVSMTLIQVEIERLKKDARLLPVLNKKIWTLSVSLSIILLISYYYLINYYATAYVETFGLFAIVLIGKFFLTLSNLYGTHLVILKKFKLNLNLNIISLVLNAISCIIAYRLTGLIGVAVASSILIMIRYFVLVYLNYRILDLKQNIKN